MRGWGWIVFCCFVVGCSGGNGPSRRAPQLGDRLVIGQGREFNSLLPMANNGFTTTELIGLAFSLLVTLNRHGAASDAAVAVPTLANGGISRDGRTITYHLRHGMRWQDGAPLTARDVLFTQRATMDPRSAVPYRDGFDRVASIAAPDPYTVVVRLRQPYRLFVTTFLGPESGTPILPEHLLAHVADIAHSAYARAPIGSGPFRIGPWRHGESVTFDANPNWYGGKAGLGRIEVRFIPDAATRLTQLRTREIDAELAASAQTATRLRGLADLRIDAEASPLFLQISFNLREPIVAELPVRRAVAAAIDAPTIARTVSHGLFDGAHGARALYGWAYDPRAGYPVYDPGAAARRLAAAGWRLAADGVRRDAHDRRLAFTLSMRADRADDNAAAVQIQQELRAVGIDVALKTFSAEQYTANDGILRAGKFAAALNGFYADIEPDPMIFFACNDRGAGGFNISTICDASADAAMNASVRTSDPAAVRDALERVQRRINALLPMIFIWQAVDLNVVPARLRNFSDLLGSPFLNCGSWALAASPPATP